MVELPNCNLLNIQPNQQVELCDCLPYAGVETPLGWLPATVEPDREWSGMCIDRNGATVARVEYSRITKDCKHGRLMKSWRRSGNQVSLFFTVSLSTAVQ